MKNLKNKIQEIETCDPSEERSSTLDLHSCLSRRCGGRAPEREGKAGSEAGFYISQKYIFLRRLAGMWSYPGCCLSGLAEPGFSSSLPLLPVFHETDKGSPRL